MCSCKKKQVVDAPPPPEYSTQESGGVSVLIGANSTVILNVPSIGRILLKSGKTTPLRYNEALSLKNSGAPIWII